MSIVRKVDDTLERELRQGPLHGVNAQVVFDTPNSEWAARRSGLCVNLFLHSVEEDTAQRHSGDTSIIDEHGVVVAYHRPPRHFRLGYALTVWGHSPRDEHRLLGTLLEWCVATEHLTPYPDPSEGNTLSLKLRETPEGAEPPAAKLWSGLGTPARPVLDVLVTVPVARPATPVQAEPVRDLALRAAHLDVPRSPEGHPSSPVRGRTRDTPRPRRNVEEVG
ncbi:DUF4255 domain-containing protein [Streptomyces sp. x-19]|uniref:DUF4255 domain-containing protein n=1 Tax=Streptomyces sp. x-19 TaxID=2789280 RepID=UPI00397FCD6E